MREGEKAYREFFGETVLERATRESEEKTMSLGEDRVRVSFNPAGDGDVNWIKTKTAELIDRLEEAKRNTADPEIVRLIALAQTDYETAVMYAVKALTAGK